MAPQVSPALPAPQDLRDPQGLPEPMVCPDPPVRQDPQDPRDRPDQPAAVVDSTAAPDRTAARSSAATPTAWTTYYTQNQQWQALGGQMQSTLNLPQASWVCINYSAVGTATVAGAPVVLRIVVDGQPVQGGACGINAVPNSWQTLSNVCAVQLPAGQHQVQLQYQAQVPGSTAYIRNPTFTAMGGFAL